MQQSRILPFGFRDDAWKLRDLNARLLFRVTFDEAHTRYSPECGFVAGRRRHNSRGASRTEPTYDEVAHYIDEHNVGTGSPLIWTTLSLAVAFRWADVQFRGWQGSRTNPRIAVIDAAQVVDRAHTAIEILNGTAGKDDDDHKRRVNYANALQIVFVADKIPQSAIICIKGWKPIEAQLPPWFLNEEMTLFVQLDPSHSKGNPKHPKIRPLFKQIRENYRHRCKGPHVERMQLKALDLALFLMPEDRIDYTHSLSLLRDLAWYILTFPIADWGCQAKGSIPLAAYSYPNRKQFDALVWQVVVGGPASDSDVQDPAVDNNSDPSVDELGNALEQLTTNERA